MLLVTGGDVEVQAGTVRAQWQLREQTPEAWPLRGHGELPARVDSKPGPMGAVPPSSSRFIREGPAAVLTGTAECSPGRGPRVPAPHLGLNDAVGGLLTVGLHVLFREEPVFTLARTGVTSSSRVLFCIA